MRIIVRLIAVFVALILASEFFVRSTLMLPAAVAPDPELGYVYKPYANVFHTSEGWAVNQMNSIGFNDDNSSVNDGRTRILVLGDSVTMALQVQRSENFTSVAEIIAPCLNVYNAGRVGLSPVHYPIVLSRVEKDFMPALAVVVVTYGDLSDMMNGNYEIVRDQTDNRITGLRIKEKSLSRLRIMLDPVLSRSALASYIMYRLNALRANKRKSQPAKGKADPSAEERERIHELLVYLLHSVNAQVPVAILYIQRLEYGTERVSAVDRKSAEFENLIMGAAADVGIQVLSTESYMSASYRENGQPGVGFPNKNIAEGHLNSLGHKATALALIDLVEDAGLECGDDEQGLVKPAQP